MKSFQFSMRELCMVALLFCIAPGMYSIGYECGHKEGYRFCRSINRDAIKAMVKDGNLWAMAKESTDRNGYVDLSPFYGSFMKQQAEKIKDGQVHFYYGGD